MLAKLSSSKSPNLPKLRETLVAIFFVLLEGFWLKRMVELLSKTHLAEVFTHEIEKKKGEKAVLLTFRAFSLISGALFLIDGVAATVS